jgi:hypothetical protein
MRTGSERVFSNYFKELIVPAPTEPLQPGRYLVGFKYPVPDTCRTDCAHVLEARSNSVFGFTGNPATSIPVQIVRRADEAEKVEVVGASLLLTSSSAGYTGLETRIHGSISVHSGRGVEASAVVVTVLRIRKSAATESGWEALARGSVTVLTQARIPAPAWSGSFSVELEGATEGGAAEEVLIVAELQRPHGRVTTAELRVPIVPRFVQPYLVARSVSSSVTF